jgi:predicted phosphodiesterase
MRTAVLADIHGNLPALRAVLTELDAEPVDAIVAAGDVVAGALVREVLELLARQPEPVHWISGSAEHEAVAACDGAATADGRTREGSHLEREALDRRWRDELASWPIALALDGVRFVARDQL